ncbi:putative acetyltransferase [Gordonia otitidis NBRC 100426]|uniref:Acetyltransferase n=1 Tax=Gordonia otitidis (strain DSM 44809 / CCUG 52243 / JCM 12355 / NBRC 100426 / IFM 10032) TaxID=1108044 RepID=H5TMF3_GORO1|nr:putative acetyltransferase [Gordonia otitidis NBRC 100426]
MLTLLARLYAAPLWLLATRTRDYTTLSYEVERWVKCSASRDLESLSCSKRFALLVLRYPEFRALVRYRLRKLPPLVRLAMRLAWPAPKTLFIYCSEIGPGLFIQHGFATAIDAESIGRDFWVNQQVTIGHDRSGKPTIGNGVRIGAGAVVVGGICVGDGAQVGVNATVSNDVRPGQILTAPPAVDLYEAARTRRRTQHPRATK